MLIDHPFSWNDITIHFEQYGFNRRPLPTTRGKTTRRGAVNIRVPWQVTRIRDRKCPFAHCEACEIEDALRCINVYLDRRVGKVSKSLRKLTLSGCLPDTIESVFDEEPGHTFKDTGGLCALRPECLKIELSWFYWSPVVLSSFDLTTLRSLTMPVRKPLDCIKIGAAFMDMPHLVNLTMTELADSEDFVDHFCHLGDGIMALSNSLRTLDMSITNCNRPKREDDAFVQPDDISFFFKAFFPEPSPDRVEALVRAKFKDPREPLDVNIHRSSKGPLDLERIRLRHIDLPWWAFETVFSPHSIKYLDLSTCRVAPNTWSDLGKYAQLYRLAGINYEILSGSCMHFLSAQQSLEFLSFARPSDIYTVAGTGLDARGMVDDVSFAIKAAPLLGPGTQWGRAHARQNWLLQSRKSWIQYEDLIQSPNSWNRLENLIRSLGSYEDFQYPKNSAFAKTLGNKTSLKHLVLPADMFDITPAFMACLAILMPALESVELGFDYSCPVSRQKCFIVNGGKADVE